MRSLVVALIVLGGCGSPPPAAAPIAPVAVSPELSPALAPLAWWLGDWEGIDGTEHWVAAAGAIYGIALHLDDSFEVMIVDDAEGGGPADGVLRLFAIPGGMRLVEFRQDAIAGRSATFGNPAHDDPKTITYERTTSGLRAVLEGTNHLDFAFVPSTRNRAPELETADLAFAADTAARGVTGWLAGFDPNGGMLRKGARIEGAVIGEMMGPLLASGKLDWSPIASHRAGRLGFTVGKATFTGATPADAWRSTYVTIWRHQPDGSWKVLFDTGRNVNEP